MARREAPRAKPRKAAKPVGRRVTYTTLDKLTPDPANARGRGKKARDAIESSLREVGAGRSILLDGKNVIRAGNGVVQGAIAVGSVKRVIVVTAGPDELVAVRRPDLTTTQAKRMAIYDNRTAELAHWVPEVLVPQLKEFKRAGLALEPLGWTAEELKPLLAPKKKVEFEAAAGPGKSKQVECPSCGHVFTPAKDGDHV